MGMTVSAVGERVVNTGNTKPQKRSVKAGVIGGACAGAIWGVRNMVKSRPLINGLTDRLLEQGATMRTANLVKYGSLGLGFALVIGTGALIGAGVMKLYNHFRPKVVDNVQKTTDGPVKVY